MSRFTRNLVLVGSLAYFGWQMAGLIAQDEARRNVEDNVGSVQILDRHGNVIASYAR